MSIEADAKASSEPIIPEPIIPSSGRFSDYRGSLLLVLGALVVWMNASFLIPVGMGAIFAAVLHPLMERAPLAHMRVSWRALILTLAFAVSFLLPIGALILLGAEEGLARIQALQVEGASQMQLSTNSIIESLGLDAMLKRAADLTPLSQSQITGLATKAVSGIGTWFVRLLQGLVASVPKALFANVVTLLTIFYLLIDGPRTVRFVRENSFFGPAQTDKILHAMSSLCYSVVVASIAAGAVQSALILIACWITGTPGAVTIALIAFVLSFLPVVGTMPVTVGLTLMSLLQGDFLSAGIFAAAILIVGTSDNIVRPWVLKGGASLHPLVGFIAAFGALDAIGFFGVFIGPVVAGLFFTVLPMITRSFGHGLESRET